jgi:hypothetical protein
MIKKTAQLLLFLAILATAIAVGADPLAEVDISKGQVAFGPIYVGEQFAFVNRTSSACAISTPSNPNEQWFSPTPISVPAASDGNSGTYTVTAALEGSWTFASSCLQNQGAHINIGVHP